MSKIYEGWEFDQSAKKSGDGIRFVLTWIWYTIKDPVYFVRGVLLL